ncbi:MAG: hypothetical protein JJE46_06960 [Acidimicrobiia bacterium]|nr:hypothetical protein [Acidimicrobiia bacterium]
MRTRRLWILLFAIGSALSVFAGCSSAEPLTVADFRNEANSICRTVRREVRRLPSADASEPERMLATGMLAIEAQRRGVRDLAALAAPTGAAADVERWLATTTQTIDAASRSLRAQRAGDFAAATRANTEGAAHAARADDLARGLGLTACVGVRQ